jgi:hypothetical protein
MTDERLEEIRAHVEASHSLFHKEIERELLAHCDALREERDELRGIVDRTEFRATLTQQAKLERQHDSALARIEKLRGALLEAKHAYLLHLEEKDYGKSVTLIVNEAIRADDAAAKGGV